MTSKHIPPCALEPAEVRLVQGVFARITSQPWFATDTVHRLNFARYVLQMYSRGLVWPEKLESFCTIAAKKYHAAPSARLDGQRILVVEDDYYAAKEASESLRALGATVVGPVGSLSEAMDIAGRDMALDGALLDVNLDGEMVYPVAGFLKMHGVPFAFVTGYEERALPLAFRSSPTFLKPADWAVVALQVPRRTEFFSV